jgi:hypothetical protein
MMEDAMHSFEATCETAMGLDAHGVVEAAGSGWTPYEEGEWSGSDRRLPDGGTLRLAREGGDGEPAVLMRFDTNMMLEWRAEFSGSAPATVLAAALNEAVRLGGHDG